MTNTEEVPTVFIAESDLDSILKDWYAAGQSVYWPHGNCNVFYRDIGDKNASGNDTALILHGFPESSFTFQKVVEPLKARFRRLVLVDLPGFGFSDKPKHLSYSLFEQVDALMWVWQSLDIRSGHAIAHDMGDSVLTEIVARSVQGLLPGWFEEGLLSLAFTNGNMVMEEARLVPIQKLLRHHKLGPFIDRFTRETLFKKQTRTSHGTLINTKDVHHLWQLYSLNEGHKLAWKTIRYLDERDKFQHPRWLNALSKFTGPVHICWGEADRVAPLAVAQYLKRYVCPKALLTVMPDVGHFCETQAPELWSESILRFYEAI